MFRAHRTQSLISHRSSMGRYYVTGPLIAILFALSSCEVGAQPVQSANDTTSEEALPRMDVLNDAQWEDLRHAIERGLDYLASQQRRDGSFPTYRTGQP